MHIRRKHRLGKTASSQSDPAVQDQQEKENQLPEPSKDTESVVKQRSVRKKNIKAQVHG